MRCNGEALPGALRPGDLAVWDGHVAMVVDNGMTIEPMYQYGCRTRVDKNKGGDGQAQADVLRF